MKLGTVVMVAFAFGLCSVALGKLTFTVLGDWGVPAAGWADSMGRLSAKSGSKFTFAIGDNFYKVGGKMGVKSVDDPKWKKVYERVFTHSFWKKRWHVIAGNHDHDGNVKAQLQYGKKHKRWYMPSLWYKVHQKVARGVTVDFFMLDTTAFYYTKEEITGHYKIPAKNIAKQKAWIKKALASSKATWKIVMGHHQVYTVKGGNKNLNFLEPLMTKAKVAAYVNGHLHHVEHVQKGKIHYITQGNGAYQKGVSKKVNPVVKAHFVFPTNEQMATSCKTHECKGFSIMTIRDKKTMVTKYYNIRNKLLYTHVVKNPRMK